MNTKKIFIIFFIALSLLCIITTVNAQTADNLKGMLIDLKGWNAKKANGMAVSLGSMKMANAYRIYTLKDKKIHTTVLITSKEEALQKMEPDIKHKPNYKISNYTIRGFKVVSVYDKRKKQGTFIVTLIKNKSNSGAIFAFNYDGLKEREAMGLVKKFDWKKMKKEAKAFLK